MLLLWISVLACGRKIHDDTVKQNNTSRRISSTDDDDFGPRSYGFNEPEKYNAKQFKPETSDARLPTASSKKVPQKIREPEIEDYGEPEKLDELNEPEKTDSAERLKPEKLEGPEDDNDDFEQLKKVKEVSIISLRPKERNKALDPITDQQGHSPLRIVRPMRDLSIVVRNRQHPLLIARQVPVHWIPRTHRPHHHHNHHPHKPHMPKHKPCKPCEPKVHKKHPHKPKKPKKKPKKEHCHHHKPKKPQHKRLLYYAPMPTAMNYIYTGRKPAKLIIPNPNFEMEESHENEEVEVETERPFQQEVEDDVEEHRLAELEEPFEEVDLAESKTKPQKKL